MADNLAVTPGSGAIIAMKESGAVKHQEVVLETLAGGTTPTPVAPGQTTKSAALPVTLASDEDLLALIGAVTASPTANTLLARLKDLLTGISLNSGTNSIGKLGANAGINIGTVDIGTLSFSSGTNAQQVQGTTAPNVQAVGNPVYMGAKAVNAEPSGLVTGTMSPLTTDLEGRLLVMPYHVPENTLNGVTSAIVTGTSTQVIDAQGAGVRIYVTDLIVTNSHATVGTFVNILDDTTVIWSGYAASSGGGFVCHFVTPLRLTANKKLNAQCLTPANVIVAASGYKGV